MGWAEEASLGEFLQTGIELRGQIVVASSALAAARLFAFPRLCKLSDYLRRRLLIETAMAPRAGFLMRNRAGAVLLFPVVETRLERLASVSTVLQ